MGLNTTSGRERPRGKDILEYTLPGGWRVLAGRTERANDYLSLRLAGPGDLWFHVRGMPGSHVVLRIHPGSADPDRATREMAAAIAAYHSKGRGGGIVSVSCTAARHVTKPRGAKPGAVEIRKETVLKVRPLNDAAIGRLHSSPPESGSRPEERGP